MNLKAVDWISFLSFISSGGLAGTLAAFGDAFPLQTKQIMAIGAIIAALAGLFVRLFSQKTGAPATAIVANAAIVPDGTAVVHDSTPVIATNVSSTSALLQTPTKGSNP